MKFSELMNPVRWAGFAAVFAVLAAWSTADAAPPAKAKAPAPKAAPAAVAAAPSSALGNAQAGAATYKQYCVACHGESGKGDGPTGKMLNPKPRDFSDAAFMKTLTDAHLVKVIADGGPAVGKSPLMAPWKGVLNEQQVKDVAAFVRGMAK